MKTNSDSKPPLPAAAARILPYLEALEAATGPEVGTNGPGDASTRSASPDFPDTEQLRVILNEWAGLPHDPDISRPELLHELFELQADARPGNVALLCSGEELTYAELEHK